MEQRAALLEIGGNDALPVTAASLAPISRDMDPRSAKSLIKELHREEKHEDSIIKKQVKEISEAEKADRKAEKSESEVQKILRKAEEHLHQVRKELERSQAKYDEALREAEKARKEVEIEQQRHGQVANTLQNAKGHLEELTHAREAHQVERETKLAQLDAIVHDK